MQCRHLTYRNKRDIHAEMIIKGHQKEPIRFQVDSGATINLISRSLVPKAQLNSTKKELNMWNNTTEKPLGECDLSLKNPKNGKSYKVSFIVVSKDRKPILGKCISEKMGLITINYENFKVASVTEAKRVEDEFAEVFNLERIGTIPGHPAHLNVRENIAPTILPPRREPIAIKEKVKVKLEELEIKKVIKRVDEPTDWVSQMAVQIKKSGDIRLCIDPRPLNEALKKEQFLLPTLDDVLPELSKSRIFTKLDLSNGYWHVPLDEISSLNTTFATPYGRYRWLRLPFGLSVSSEIFQKRLHDALVGLEGTLCVADDIVVHGEDVATHDQRLHALLTRCKEKGIKLNKDKSEIRRTDITFIGHKITKEGLQADPEKIQGIVNMDRPNNKEEVQTLQGTVNYLAKFMPHLSDVMKPIRDLTKQGIDFMWGRAQEDAFKEIKKLATASPILAFYDQNKELILQCDASNKGLGAVLLQDGRPVAYKSRALSPTEVRYATIEKEMLAIVWGLEKFHQYTYGRQVQVHSDHKPLEAIMKKPLALAPRRLQNMLMRALNYDFEVIWKQGKTQVIADLLSRSIITEGDEDFEAVNACTFLPMGIEKIKRIKNETDTDEVMMTLKETIMKGWPDRENTPAVLTPYHSFADEMTIQDGIIFKGDRVVIPLSMRADMKREVHGAHGGVQACLSRARESIFWPGMTSEIRQFVETCETCRKYEMANAKETLMPHEIPERQWEKIGADLFELNGDHYLVTVDYFSNFWELDRLNSTKSTEVIRKLKAHCARYGSPCKIITDNAQQFVSDEFR